MSNIRIILLKKISNIGNKNEIFTVKLGYAWNFLIPKKMALPIFIRKTKRKESYKNPENKNDTLDLENIEKMTNILSTMELTISSKTTSKGKLFGAITQKKISETLSEKGIFIKSKNIFIPKIIKHTGAYSVNIHTKPGTMVQLNIIVVSKNI
jgi:large subunit ribosomal protein L9